MNLRRCAAERPELGLAAALVAASLAGSGPADPDLMRAGAFGAVSALVAIAVVLVFRAVGVVSFAHFGIAALVAVLGGAFGPAGLVMAPPLLIFGAVGVSLALHRWAYARLAHSARAVGTLAGMLAMQLLLAARVTVAHPPGGVRLPPLLWHVVAAAGVVLVLAIPVLLRPLLDDRVPAPLVCGVAGALAGSAGVLAVLLFGGGSGPLSGAAVAEFPVVGMATAMIAAGMAGLRDPGLAAVMAFVLAVALSASEARFGSPHAYLLALMPLLSAALMLRRRRIPPVIVDDRAPDPVLPASFAAILRGMWAPLVVAVLVGIPVLAVVAGRRPVVAELAGYCLVGLSLMMLMGWIGQVTLGQLGFALLGAWITTASGLPTPVGILAGAVAATILSPAVAYTAIRHAGAPAPVTSLAWGLFSYTLFTSPELLGWARVMSAQTEPFTAAGSGGPGLLVAVAAVGCLGGVALAYRTRVVRLLVAARIDPAIARRASLNLPRARLTALLFTGFVAGTGGGLLGVAQGGVLPSGYATDSGVRLVTSTGMGGIGTVLGPMVGAVIFGGVIAAFAGPAIRFVVTGALGLGVLLSEPDGLAGLARRLRAAVRRGAPQDAAAAAPTVAPAEIAVNDAQI